ncbi:MULTISPECIES: YybH family protein [unclassified Mesorhizobium]|uniref:YybH family protein n=1 Tax=unclassified Mesorhizobium TaxID=325217 RepID=UPI0030156EFA
MSINTDRKEIRAVMDAIRQAHHDKNAARVIAQYEPEALIFDLAPPLDHRPDIDGLSAWFDTWQGPVEIEAHDFEITIDGDIAFCHGFYRTSATTKQGGELAVFWSRATVCLKRANGVWKIAHEHTSVPFYMDGSFRAAIDLEPKSKEDAA